MKKEDIMRAMNDIDEQYIDEADSENEFQTAKKDKKLKRRKSFRKKLVISAAAACFVGVFLLGYATSQRSGMGADMGSMDGMEAKSTGSLAGAVHRSQMDSVKQEEALADAASSSEQASAESQAYASDGYSSNGYESIESQDGDGAIQTDKLVYTCNMSIQTKDYQASKQSIKEKIDRLGGMIESESESDYNYSWYADDESDSGYLHWNLTIRIPTEKYEEFMDSVGETGKVISRSANVENISKEYHSTESEIQALETQLQKLQELMNQTQSVSDMITIEGRISEVEAELNSQKSWLVSMDTDVAYSTIYLNLDEVEDYSRIGGKNASFGKRILNAIRNSWRYFLTGLETLLFGLIYILPFAIVIAAIIWIVKKIKNHKR